MDNYGNNQNSQPPQNSQTPLNSQAPQNSMNFSPNLMDPSFFHNFKLFMDQMANNPQNQPNFTSSPNFYPSPNPQISSEQSSYISPTSFPYGNEFSSQSPQMRPTRPVVGQARSSRAILQETDDSAAYYEDGDEEEEEEIANVEGATPLVPTNTGRVNSTNWNMVEDKALCSAYIHAGGDTAKGADQKGKHYWGAIFKLYEEARLENPLEIKPRNITGLKMRWKRINYGVGKFAGVFAEASRMRQSGKSDDDVITDARNLFAGPPNEKGQTGPKFMLEHCWDMLKMFPKWDGLPEIAASSAGGGSSKRSTPEGTSDDSEVVKRRRAKGKSVHQAPPEQIMEMQRDWQERDDKNRAIEAEKVRLTAEMFEYNKSQQAEAKEKQRLKIRMRTYHNLMLKQNRTPDEEARYAKLDKEFRDYE